MMNLNTKKQSLMNLMISLAVVILMSACKSVSEAEKVVLPELPVTNQPPVWTYKMAVIWPTGFCKEDTRKPCYTNKVVLPKTFSIHGLWYIDRTKTATRSAQQFDLKLLEDIKGEMYEFWLDIPDYDLSTKQARKRHDTATVVFWEKEWKKHGQLDPLFKNNLHLYYQHTLQLFQGLDLTNILINLSGQPNTPDLLRHALSLHHRRMPLLLCNKDKDTGQMYLSELHFCMDATASAYVDCQPRQPLDTKDCRDGQSFLY